MIKTPVIYEKMNGVILDSGETIVAEIYEPRDGGIIDRDIRGNEIATAINDHADTERRLKIAEDALDDANSQLTGGWQYLMSVPADDITVEDALEAFGFGRNGLQEGRMFIFNDISRRLRRRCSLRRGSVGAVR